MLQAAPPGPVFASSHDAASNPGHYRVAGEVSWGKYIHYNKWRCTAPRVRVGNIWEPGGCGKVNEGGLELLDGITDSVEYTDCEVDTSTGGCGHQASNGWMWDRTTPGVNNGHHTANTGKPGSRQCTVGAKTFSIADDATTCGDWVPCTDGVLTGGDPPTGCTPCAEGYGPNGTWTACEPRCTVAQHKHAAEVAGGHTDCQAAHRPPPDHCVPGVDRDDLGEWTPGHDGADTDGHTVFVAGCDEPDDVDDPPPTPEPLTPEPLTPEPPVPCSGGEHRHAQAAGGHTGCRAAHSPPQCTWSSTATWSPGHGGDPADGHATTTGMRRCVSTRSFCASSGQGVLDETVGRQSDTSYSYDSRGLLGAGPERDRIPYGGNLDHDQFVPSLTFAGVASPGRIQVRPGEWSAVSYTVRFPANRSLAAESYDWDNRRWRNCGRVAWTLTLTGTVDDRLESSGGRVRFPPGDCPGAAGVPLTVNAAWRVSFDSRGGDAYDVTETNTRSSRWLVYCRSTANVAGLCDSLTDAQLAALAFGDRALSGAAVAAGGQAWNGAAIPDLLAGRAGGVTIQESWTNKWAPAGRPPGPWTQAGGDSSGVLAAISVGRGWQAPAYAVNPRDGARRKCGEIGFRLKSLTLTAGLTGDAARRRPLAAGSPSNHTWRDGGRVYRYERYAMNADDAAARFPITCTAVYPTLTGGRWDTWGAQPQHDNLNAMTAAQTGAFNSSLAACTGYAFLIPAPQRGDCHTGGIDITLTAAYEAGTIIAGQPDRPRGGEWVRGTRFERIPAWTGERAVTVAEYTYRGCPVLGF